MDNNNNDYQEPQQQQPDNQPQQQQSDNQPQQQQPNNQPQQQQYYNQSQQQQYYSQPQQQQYYSQPIPPYGTQNEPPVSLGDWVITLLVLSIPCVGIIMILVWAFSSGTNNSKKNFCRALLIFALIGIVISMLLGTVIIGFLREIAYSLF